LCECKTKAMNKVSFHAPVSDRIRTAGFVLVALVYVISGFRAVNWRTEDGMGHAFFRLLPLAPACFHAYFYFVK